MYKKYVIEEKSSKQIAEICNIKSDQTVLNWLKKHEIPARKSGQRSASKQKKLYPTDCCNCGKTFYVDMRCKTDPNNKRKFVRACSDECTASLRSAHMKSLITEGKIDNKNSSKYVRELEKSVLVDMYCYRYMLLADIATELKAKQTTVVREMERLKVPKHFIRKCPQCGKEYSCNIRSMVDESSNKFKKFCTRKCFLSSRAQTGTWIEVEIASFLDEKGVSYIDQYEIDRMTIDFCIPEKDLLIEANGDFWHANPDIYGKEKPLHKIHRRVIAKDQRKQKQLEEKGYKVVVVWENDLATNKEETLNNLYEIIKGA